MKKILYQHAVRKTMKPQIVRTLPGGREGVDGCRRVIIIEPNPNLRRSSLKTNGEG
jgi:hypothetical protein